MPTKLDCFSRIKAVEREHGSIQFALDFVLIEAAAGRIHLPNEHRMREFRGAVAMLEGTYTVRLFAEFETCLRSCWSASRNTDPPSRASDLIDGTAARLRIPHAQIHDVHAVRRYRNSLVHERDDLVDAVDIANARGNLCRFMAFLPESW
jgi:hypothetical protein